MVGQQQGTLRRGAGRTRGAAPGQTLTEVGSEAQITAGEGATGDEGSEGECSASRRCM